MKTSFASKRHCLALFCALALSSALQAQVRTLFDEGWLFDGRPVNLPHDWSIDPLNPADFGPEVKVIGPFASNAPGGTAVGFTMGGVHTYTKDFVTPQSDQLTQTWIYFEGAYNQTQVYVNDVFMGENVYGYSAFRFNMTEALHPAGETNTLRVIVTNRGRNSRWYSGSGIYRHVWLEQYPDCHLDAWDTFVFTDRLKGISKDGRQAAKALLGFSTVIRQEGQDVVKNNGKLCLTLSDAQGHTVLRKSLRVPKNGMVKKTLKLRRALLWSPEQPSLYTLRLSLNGGPEMSVRTGIRSLMFTSDKGFLLNGQPCLLRGGCIHHDNGVLGAAAFDKAEFRKIELLKKRGFNAIRGSHNPMSESLLAACDSLGMMVIDESFDSWKLKKNKEDYSLYFDEWSRYDMQTLVRRDRNHPSVIMWSIGNEIRERAYESGVKIAADLRGYIHELDTTRPITAGINSLWNKDRTARESIDPACINLDVAGYNYRYTCYEPDHANNPERVIFGSESVALEAASNWQRVETLPYVIGDFQWTAMDYLGEAGIGNIQTDDAQENVHYFMPFPWFNGFCGDIDLIGEDKPQSAYRDVVWGTKPLAVAVEPARHGAPDPRVSFWGWIDEQPCWGLPGTKTGDSVRVNIYSQAPEVDLWLNGKHVATVSTDTVYIGHAMLAYQPGRLEARIPQTDTRITLDTPGPAYKLKTYYDNSRMTADGQDLKFIMIELQDNQGRRIFDSEHTINLKLTGDGAVIAGTGNACPNDMESFHSMQPRLYNGQAQIVLRSSGRLGQINLEISSEGLSTSSIVILEAVRP